MFDSNMIKIITLPFEPANPSFSYSTSIPYFSYGYTQNTVPVTKSYILGNFMNFIELIVTIISVIIIVIIDSFVAQKRVYSRFLP